MRPRVCSSCGTAACEDCLQEWETKDNKCPRGCEHFKYGKASKFLNNWLNKILVKCENRDRGCPDVLPHKKIEKHQATCTYAAAVCQNAGCGESMTKGEMPVHQDQCGYYPLRCQGCQMFYVRSEQGTHSCVTTMADKMARMEEMLEKLVAKEEAPKEHPVG